MLTEQEAKSKGYLQKLAEYKQELSAIKFEVVVDHSLTHSQVARKLSPT